MDIPSIKKTDGLLKTPSATPSATPPSLAPAPEDSKTRRVAKFLILIGSNHAAKILSELDPQQVEEISKEIAAIQKIVPEEAESVLAEFKALFSSPRGNLDYSGASSGGVETARRILYAAYGPEKGEALLNKSVPDSKENIFDFLEEFTPEQLVFLLKDESPTAAALVLARLAPKVTAETLKKFPPALKPEILMRIARQNEVSPETLERVAEAIREKARHLSGSSQDIAIDGMQALAAILKQGDYSLGDRIINELETGSPDIGKDLKERLYTLDDVLAIFDGPWSRPLAEKLTTMQDREIAILLKGRSGEFCEKILSNVSGGRRNLIREEGEILGAVPKRDCDDAANNFIAWFRQARENGELILSSDEDWVT
ncbi:MAG: flagellar motor switch protein FliG [Treponema sp.]|jgi:flagellar motor switch protein FliG|nr:flagellar motor switch protein FliG [Treponema sp.]